MSLTSRTIAAMRLPLALMVVFIHTYRPSFASAVLPNFLNYKVTTLCSDTMSNIAVPAFFVISGYLFFLKMQKSNFAFYKNQWIKRIYTLLIPYIIFNIIRAFHDVFLVIVDVLRHDNSWSGVIESVDAHLDFSIFWTWIVFGEVRQVVEWFQSTNQIFAPVSGALWYIRELLIMVLFAPVLCWLLRKTRGFVLLLPAVLYVLRIHFFIHQSTITALLYFGVGAWFAICHNGFAELAIRHLKWTLPVWVVFIVVNVLCHGTDFQFMLYPWMILVGVCAFVGLVAKWLVDAPIYRNRFIIYASDNTFFIYLAHVMVCTDITRLIIYRLSIEPLVVYLITPFLTVVVCLSILRLMRFFMPRVTAFMLGERVNKN